MGGKHYFNSVPKSGFAPIASQLLQQGNEQLKAGQFEAAIQAWQQALTLYREIQDRKGEGESFASLGVAYSVLGDYSKALDYYLQGLAIARELNDCHLEKLSLQNLGTTYDTLGEYNKVIECFQPYIRIAREIQDREGEGYALEKLGYAYWKLKDYTNAIELFQQTAAVARELPDPKLEMRALARLGMIYDAKNDLDKAIEFFQQTLTIAQEIEDREGEKVALGNLGDVYLSLEDYAEAINSFKPIVDITKELQDSQGESRALRRLAETYYFLGNLGNAFGNYWQGLKIAQEIKDRDGEMAALNSLGSTMFRLGDLVQAIEFYQQYLMIARELQNRKREGKALGNLGLAYANHLGDYAKAIEYFEQDLAIAREFKDCLMEGQVLGYLGGAYLCLGEYDRAVDYYQQSLTTLQKTDYRRGEGLALQDLGYALFKTGKLAEAEKKLRIGIAVLESIRERVGSIDEYKVSIFEQQAPGYRTLQQVLIAQNKPEAALEIAERGRGRAFVELLEARLTTSATQQAINSLTIAHIQQIAKQQNATLVEYSIIRGRYKYLDELKDPESELFIWVIKPTGEVTFRRVDLKSLWQEQNTSLADLVRNTRISIGVRKLTVADVVENCEEWASQAKRLKQLHKLLIQPIADLLPADPSAHIIFIPQQFLFLVPFPALQDASGKYLIEKHTILTAPSIQVLSLTHQQGQRVGLRLKKPVQQLLQDVLVVGNPIMPKVAPEYGKPVQQLSNLPWAEQEAKDVAALLKTQAVTGSGATKAIILQRMSQARIIHLATHGLLDEFALNDFRGEGSAIALAPSDKDNGLLTAWEILNLKLNAELVVLSACDTGRGYIKEDGVIGLSRSLIVAGVPSIIVSLWSVPDNSTAFLMTEFYKNLQQNFNKAQALRQAMLTTMKRKQYSNPLQWAAFTLIGEAE